LKVGNRLGDNAEMCIIELVDYNENMLSAPKKEAGKKRRSRKKGDAVAAEGAPKKEAAAPKAKAEAKVAETPVVSAETEEKAE